MTNDKAQNSSEAQVLQIQMTKLLFQFSLIFFLAATWTHAEYRITHTKGSVAVVPKGAKKASPAVKNLTLEKGDHIVTGEGGEVDLSNRKGNVVRLKEKSNLEVESFSGQMHVFFLRAGQFWGSFRKSGNINIQLKRR